MKITSKLLTIALLLSLIPSPAKAMEPDDNPIPLNLEQRLAHALLHRNSETVQTVQSLLDQGARVDLLPSHSFNDEIDALTCSFKNVPINAFHWSPRDRVLAKLLLTRIPSGEQEKIRASISALMTGAIAVMRGKPQPPCDIRKLIIGILIDGLVEEQMHRIEQMDLGLIANRTVILSILDWDKPASHAIIRDSLRVQIKEILRSAPTSMKPVVSQTEILRQLCHEAALRRHKQIE